jgi:hypothetical protein
MEKFFLSISLVLTIVCKAQKQSEVITAKEVERIERVLSSDDMMGREAGTEGSNKAARFIADEFKKAGLQTWNNSPDYLQSFKVVQPKSIDVKGELQGQIFDPQKIMVLTTKAELEVTDKSGYEFKTIGPGANLLREGYKLSNENKSYVVLVDTSYAKDFARLARLKRPGFASENSVVFLLTNTTPKAFKINAKHEISEMPMANVLGILPGKTKSNEYVIFSAHYDHLGIGKPLNGDSVYNGANDDAAGTTAVIMLANYFKKLNNNARTLVFTTFTAEEIGGFGSQYFSKQFDPKAVMAMFNIEMIGTESKWGKNSAYITGFEKTDMGKILQDNLKGTAFTFHPDPYPEQDLFYRSDNATLASLGVPAHTISTSKMDSEKFYHTADDEIETLDMQNMAAIINAIAQSSKSIVDGKATPTRVDTSNLR